mmetsp:Transcript_12760/g.18621  ORF Transcript_12760/g.18621 Transcript_12760/m.18621 type:complete len:195 (-) Transcript_12760:69-653(-)|eukprot:CAMPEP_0197234010 /NCGR_PEP_ID=MMETSP1429-20130617/1882_1 /TAXON_ID=49237 /ORGANISM="Chaetoceros  sp., Strain UNC1202" /LENGTH=194 /DNA_ID=CAMNT_0042692335 /DNA_START=294 /DNA_END=878 /DNA_ORIENTATION=-
MELTEEQKERSRKNRERALEIRRRKQEEAKEKEKLMREEQLKQQQREEGRYKPNAETNSNAFNAGESTRNAKTQEKITNNEQIAKEESKDEDDVELEDFEIDASPYVTKKDAMKVYCLPEGTIAVCSYVEKDNPRQPKWNKMKLYQRSEIRKWARERWGSLEGLVAERRKREMKRFEKDLEDVKDVFKTKKRKK